eukprot:4822252-Karenia_brevis.AAC.1
MKDPESPAHFGARFVVAHAPNSACAGGPAHITAWHESLWSLCNAPSPTFLLADMNGRHDFLCNEGLVLTSDKGIRVCGEALAVFEQNTSTKLMYDPHAYTWTSIAGYRHTIDYIGVPDVYVHACVDVHTLPQFDCLFDAESRHVPVMLTIACSNHSLGKVQGCKIRADPQQFADPIRVQAFQTHLESVRPLPLTEHPETQYRHILSHLKSAAESAFPYPTVHKRKFYVSDETWQLIQQRKQLRSYKRKLGRFMKKG